MGKNDGEKGLNNNLNAVVIMAKSPIPNQVKTRMIRWLDPSTVSSLYYNFLLDKIEQVKNIEAHIFIAYTPENSADFFRSIIPPGFTLINQVGPDLGERLVNISKYLFSLGFKKVAILDSDTPNLPPEYIQEGFTLLNKSDVVLGPCEDGGYYLIGLKTNQPQLFDGIPWSTSKVTELTIKKAQRSGLIVCLLEKWYDIDTVEDLKRLKYDLDTTSENQNSSFFCENTYRAIAKWMFNFHSSIFISEPLISLCRSKYCHPA
jgi:rSAM/selenodomain-associated transferase 1